jgi:prepilin-type N-terminal cleavage/methylation domain-containing protein
MKRNTKPSGFTIIELLIATIIFSMILIVILSAFLQVGRMFYKGISMANTQEAARRVAEDVIEDVHFAQEVSPITSSSGDPTGNTKYFCIGYHRYTYNLKQKVTTANIGNEFIGVQKATFNGTCPDPAAVPATAANNLTQLLGPDMQLNNFNLNCSTKLCDVSLHIIFYGADNGVFSSPSNPTATPAQALLEPDAQCSGNLLSTQFCAFADLRTSVTLRE